MKVARAAAALALAAAIAGCAAQTPPHETAPEETAAPSPTAETAPATVTPTPTPSGWTAPDSCAGIEAGATVDGADLGACVQDVLVAQGSGRISLSGPMLRGTVDFTFEPDYAFHLDGTGGTDIPFDLWFVDGAHWLDRGDGAVEADASSDDRDQQIAAEAADYAAPFSDPRAIAELIAASPAWEVAAEPAAAGVYRIASTAPFRWNEVDVDTFVLRLASDATPLSAEVALTVHGFAGTVTQTFERLGQPVEITAPTG
ncbi:hypothetical protein M1D46_01735 [Microbacterium sp. JZ70]